MLEHHFNRRSTGTTIEVKRKMQTTVALLIFVSSAPKDTVHLEISLFCCYTTTVPLRSWLETYILAGGCFKMISVRVNLISVRGNIMFYQE